MGVGASDVVVCEREEACCCEWVVEDDEECGCGVVVLCCARGGEVADVRCESCGHGGGGCGSSFPFEEEGVCAVVRVEDAESVRVDGSEGSVVMEVSCGSVRWVDVGELVFRGACLRCEGCEE